MDGYKSGSTPGIFFNFLKKYHFYQNGVSLPPVCGEYVHNGRPLFIHTFDLLFPSLQETFGLGFLAVALVLMVF